MRRVSVALTDDFVVFQNYLVLFIHILKALTGPFRKPMTTFAISILARIGLLRSMACPADVTPLLAVRLKLEN